MAGVRLERLHGWAAPTGHIVRGDTASLATLTDKHVTMGGINQQLMTDLRREGVPDVVRHAFDRILTRLREQLALPGRSGGPGCRPCART